MSSSLVQPVVEPSAPVDVGVETLWNESQYLWWYDADAGIAGFHRIAHMPNDGAGKAQLWNVVLHHDGRRFRRCSEIRFRPEWRRDGAYRAEDLEFRHRDGSIEITSDGPELEIDLRFTDFHPPVSAMGHAGLANDHVAAGHVDAGGSVQGTVTLDKERITVKGLGFRDHSWGGQRDMQRFRSTRWANGTAGQDFSFCVGYMTTSGFTDARYGWALIGGVPVLVPDFELIVDYELDGICWRTASLLMRPANAEPIRIEFGPTFDGVVLESQGWTAYETATRLTVNGVAGVGNVESATNPRGGGEFPRVVQKACTREGLSVRERTLQESPA